MGEGYESKSQGTTIVWACLESISEVEAFKIWVEVGKGSSKEQTAGTKERHLARAQEHKDNEVSVWWAALAYHDEVKETKTKSLDTLSHAKGV